MKDHSLVLFNSFSSVEQKKVQSCLFKRSVGETRQPAQSLTLSGPGRKPDFLPPAGNNTGRKTIRISRVAAVGTNSESKRYLPREKGNSLVKEEIEFPAPGPECGRANAPHARFSRLN